MEWRGKQGAKTLLHPQPHTSSTIAKWLDIYKNQILAVIEYFERICSCWEADNRLKQGDTAYVEYILQSWGRDRKDRAGWVIGGKTFTSSRWRAVLMIYPRRCHRLPSAVFLMAMDKSIKASVFSHLLQVNKKEQICAVSTGSVRSRWVSAVSPWLKHYCIYKRCRHTCKLLIPCLPCTGSCTHRIWGILGLTEQQSADGCVIIALFFVWISYS